SLELLDFDNALEQFQELVDKMIIQKTRERSGLYTEDDDKIDYSKFYKTTQALFGSAVKDHNIQAFFRKTINNLEKPDWLEIFGCFTGETVGLPSQLKGSTVFLVSEKQQITDSVIKRKDMIKSIVKISHLDFTITASQKGVITVFNNQRKSFFRYFFDFHQDTAWITGCDFLPQLKYIVAVTESTIIVWDYKSEEHKNNCFVIKPMRNCLLCVCTVTTSDVPTKDSILMGDDKGYVYLLTMTSDHFIMKQCKAEKESQFRVLDSENFNTVKRKLHDDWVGRVKYIAALKCFGSCSSDRLCSFVLDDIKRLEDNL
ncbi:WDR64 protein, partial [Scytalopus superciliaris]|nr:WDR64 protein [Scytalopus superciliaris]